MPASGNPESEMTHAMDVCWHYTIYGDRLSHHNRNDGQTHNTHPSQIQAQPLTKPLMHLLLGHKQGCKCHCDRLHHRLPAPEGSGAAVCKATDALSTFAFVQRLP